MPAMGSLGRKPAVSDIENRLVVLDPGGNSVVELTPAFKATGVSLNNYSDNHIRVVLTVDGANKTAFVAANMAENYNFQRGVIEKVSVVAVDAPQVPGGGEAGISTLTQIVSPSYGFVDIDLIRER